MNHLRLDWAQARSRARNGEDHFTSYLAKLTHVFVPVSLLVPEFPVGVKHVINVLDDEAWHGHVGAAAG